MTDNPSTSSALTQLSPERQAALQALRKTQNSRTEIVSYDSIKLKDSEKRQLDVDGKPLPRGEFFIESYDAAAGEKRFRCIGPNPEIVILHRCWTYSKYVDGVGLVAWTSEIQDRSEWGMVTLFSKKDGKARIEFQGPYKPDFKDFIKERYTTAAGPNGYGKSELKYQNVLYVLFEGKVYRMFVSKTSEAGIAPGEKKAEFKDPQPGSLILFAESNCTAGTDDGALVENVCRLGSQFRDDLERPFHLITFENVGPTPLPLLDTAIGEALKIVNQSQKAARDAQEKHQIAALRAETKASSVIDVEVPDIEPVVSYQSEVKVEDLPF